MTDFYFIIFAKSLLFKLFLYPSSHSKIISKLLVCKCESPSALVVLASSASQLSQEKTSEPLSPPVPQRLVNSQSIIRPSSSERRTYKEFIYRKTYVVFIDPIPQLAGRGTTHPLHPLENSKYSSRKNPLLAGPGTHTPSAPWENSESSPAGRTPSWLVKEPVRTHFVGRRRVSSPGGRTPPC